MTLWKKTENWIASVGGHLFGRKVDIGTTVIEKTNRSREHCAGKTQRQGKKHRTNHQHTLMRLETLHQHSYTQRQSAKNKPAHIKP